MKYVWGMIGNLDPVFWIRESFNGRLISVMGMWVTFDVVIVRVFLKLWCLV